MKQDTNEMQRMQKLAGIEEFSDAKVQNTTNNSASKIDSTSELSKELKLLASNIAMGKVKGLDAREIEQLIVFLKNILNKSSGGSIAPQIDKANLAFNNATKNIKVK
jgi:hypothetical protein